MSETLTITKTEGTPVVLHLEGNLDGQTEAAFAAAATAVKESGAGHLLIDLGGLKMLTSAGLRGLHNVYKLFTPAAEADAWHKANPGHTYKSPYVKIAGASPNIHYVLSVSGFLQNIPIYPTVAEARNSF